jgi:hypothetical protein
MSMIYEGEMNVISNHVQCQLFFHLNPKLHLVFTRVVMNMG